MLNSLPFTMPGDFTPITLCGYTPVVLVVNLAKVAAKNASEFAALVEKAGVEAQ